MSSSVDVSIGSYVTDVKGNVLKREKDCSDIADKALDAAKEFMSENNLKEALKVLLAAEKQARMAVDLKTTSRVMIYIIQACFSVKDYYEMNENVSLLVKRRAQLKDAVTSFIKECCLIADQITNIDEQIRFIETVTGATEGRVYVENERARLTRKLANIYEKQGNLNSATKLMQELQVESYLLMPNEEKVDFMLEQLRLVFQQENYSLAQTISNKIIPSKFSDNFEMTNRYHILMARLQCHFKNYIKVSGHYKSLLNSKFVQPGTAIWAEAARGVIVILLMAERCEDQVDEIKKMRKFKSIDVVAPYCELLSLFLHNELIDIDWFVKKYRNRFHNDLMGLVCNFDLNTSEGRGNWQTFLDRITEYNIYVISQHYSTVKLVTMSTHLKLSVEKVEEYICSLVVRDSLYARINWPEGYVSFVEHKSESTVLNEWAKNFQQLVVDLKSLNDNINKEISIHDAKSSNSNQSNAPSKIAEATEKRMKKLSDKQTQ